MTPLARRRNDDEGIGLVELIVVIAIAIVVGTVLLNVVISGLRTSAYAQTRVHAVADTQVAIERVSREVRAADPLRRADPDAAHLDVRRDGRLYHYRYDAVDNGDGTFRLVEQRLTFDDPNVFDAIDFDPYVEAPDADQTRVLVDQLADASIFRHLDAEGQETGVPRSVEQVEIVVDRVIEDGRPTVRVETAVKVRNA